MTILDALNRIIDHVNVDGHRIFAINRGTDTIHSALTFMDRYGILDGTIYSSTLDVEIPRMLGIDRNVWIGASELVESCSDTWNPYQSDSGLTVPEIAKTYSQKIYRPSEKAGSEA